VSTVCKPICKPYAPEWDETEETEQNERTVLVPVRRGHRIRERSSATRETYVALLITQRSRVQIPPPLPRPEAPSRTEKGPLACGLCTDLFTAPGQAAPLRAAGSASAPGSALGRPAQRTRGYTTGNWPQISWAHPTHSRSWAARSRRPVVQLREGVTRAFRAVTDAALRLRDPRLAARSHRIGGVGDKRDRKLPR
jgi:hypothetical protein